MPRYAVGTDEIGSGPQREIGAPRSDMKLSNSAKVLTAAFLTTPLIITVVGLGCLAVLLVKILWLNFLPELFPRASVIGDLVENILAATVAAYVFFVISYQVPQVIERRRIGRSIVQLAYSVSRNVYGIYISMCDPPEIRLNDVTVDTVLERFRSVPPNAPSRIMGPNMRPLIWIQVLIDYTNRFCDDISKTWRYSRFIDPELAALLDGLEFSSFTRQMQSIAGLSAKVGNPSLEVWATAYFECYEHARALAMYCDGYVKLYGL